MNYDADGDYAVHEHFDLPDDQRVEVDYNGWKGDPGIFLELFDPEESVLVLLTPKKARKIGQALVKAAENAKKNK